jgi:acyl dehydratase
MNVPRFPDDAEYVTWEHVSEPHDKALAATDFDTTFIHVDHTRMDMEPSWNALLRAPSQRVRKTHAVVPFSVVSSAYLLGVLQTITVVWWVF